MFFDYEPGVLRFKEFGLNHLIPFLLIIGGVIVIYLLRDKIRNSKYEKHIRYGIAFSLIFWELAYQLWYILNGKWVFPDSMPIGLCAFSLFLGIYVLFTKSWKVFEIAYFWSLGGLISILFPDILHGPDRFRYWQFMLSHIFFFWAYMYMMFVHRYIPNNKSFKKSFWGLLALVLIVIIPINFWWGANYMYLAHPGETPFSIFPTEPYVLYAALCILLAMVVITLWYSPIWIYHQIQKKKIKEQ